MPIFLVGEAPFCRFIPPRIVRDRYSGTNSAKRRLCRTFTRRPLPIIPFALRRDQEAQQARRENSAERELVSLSAQIARYYSGPIVSDRKESPFLKWALNLDGDYEREVIYSEKLSRLEAVEAAEAPKNRSDPKISDPDHEPLRSPFSTSTLGNSHGMEDEKWALSLEARAALREPQEQQQQQLEYIYNKGKKKMRSRVLQHCIPPFLDRIGFRSTPKKIFPDRLSHLRAARVNVTMAYRMSYVMETTSCGLDVAAEEPDIDVDSNSYSLRKGAPVFASSMDSRMSLRETTNVKTRRMVRERVHQMGVHHSISHFGGIRSGRFLHPNFHPHSGSGRSLQQRSRVPVPPQNGAVRRLWLRADSGVESAGNLFQDLLTIIGLVAFVVSGTYAFATLSHEYFKSANWFKKMPSESVMVPRSAPEFQPKPPNLTQISVAELTDENFVDTIQQKPTFVLFYANWCPYCQKLDPTWNALGEILSNKGYDVQLVRMNAEVHPNTAKNFKVVKYPTLIFFKGGVAADNYLGPRTVNSLMEFIESNIHNKC